MCQGECGQGDGLLALWVACVRSLLPSSGCVSDYWDEYYATLLASLESTILYCTRHSLVVAAHFSSETRQSRGRRGTWDEGKLNYDKILGIREQTHSDDLSNGAYLECGYVEWENFPMYNNRF